MERRTVEVGESIYYAKLPLARLREREGPAAKRWERWERWEQLCFYGRAFACFHGFRSRIMALRVTSILRMRATVATLGDFPASRR
jgi:hypothetical protein